MKNNINIVLLIILILTYVIPWPSIGSSANSLYKITIYEIMSIIQGLILLYYFLSFSQRVRKKYGKFDSMFLESRPNMDEKKVKEIDPDIDISQFNNQVFETYKSILIACMEFDTDTIRRLTPDEIYNMYCSKLELLKIKGKRKIVKDITLNEVSIINMEKDGDIITLTAYLSIKCYLYTIKESTGKIISGNSDHKVNIECILTFVKSTSNNNEVETCPNCGAKVEIISSSTCPYCGSTLVKNSASYVMSKEKIIKRRLDKNEGIQRSDV